MTSGRGASQDDLIGAVPHDDVPKIVSILGATGSIGRSTAQILKLHPDRFRVSAVAGGRDAEALARTAIALGARKLGYRGVGTIEFLYEDGHFYFIEMNTRIQVEHPVTEMITGIDLVNEQIRIASGSPLTLSQADVRLSGHAIECRVNAEHPDTFRPSPGRISYYHPPGGLGVRVDSAAYQGYVIPPYYDSLVGKLVVHGRTRTEALMRLRRALDEFIVDGIDTTLPLFRTLVRNTDVQNGAYDIHWLEQFLAAQAD